MKITILLDYPDNANPKFTGGMAALGGAVESVYFGDLFAETEPGEYSQGLCNDGPTILRNGILMTPEEIVARLNYLSRRVVVFPADSIDEAAMRNMLSKIEAKLGVSNE